MGVVSEKYIMQRLKAFMKSEAGKAFIADHLRDAYDKSIDAGGITREDVDDILKDIKEEFIDAVKDVIPSFRGECVHVNAGAMDKKNKIRASISVEDEALRRESLHYMNRDLTIGHGGGIDDILALFTHGYTLTKRPYGFWVRNTASSPTGTPLVRIGALMHRDPNPFLEKFVELMNYKYADICSITLNDKYTKGGE